MKITKRQLKRIIREMHPRAAADDAYVEDLEKQEDDLATQIRHASKDIHGRKHAYDLEGKSVEELEDILYDLSNSPEQRDIDDMYRDEEEDAMGRDLDLSQAETAPKRQGFGRRPSGSKGQRRMESTMKLTKKELIKIIREEAETIGAENAKISADNFGGAEISKEPFVDVEEDTLLNQNENPGSIKALELIPESRENVKKTLRKIVRKYYRT